MIILMRHHDHYDRPNYWSWSEGSSRDHRSHCHPFPHQPSYHPHLHPHCHHRRHDHQKRPQASKLACWQCIKTFGFTKQSNVWLSPCRYIYKFHIFIYIYICDIIWSYIHHVFSNRSSVGNPYQSSGWILSFHISSSRVPGWQRGPRSFL